jgi:membrane dipeptidase
MPLRELTRLVAAAATLTGLLPAVARAEDDAALRHARELLRDVPLVDGHNDLPWVIREDEKAKGNLLLYDLRAHAPQETDLQRLREGQVAGQFWSVWIPSVEAGSARLQLEQIDLARRMIAAYPEALVFATRSSDIAAAKRAGKVASFLGMENGRALENSLGALRAYYDLGVRYLTLTHGRGTDWADSATDTPSHGGLTPFGREVVREMNRLGMLVDLSHTAPTTMHAALDTSAAPAFFSHSSARAVCDHPRNVPDDVLARVRDTDGLVMVTFVPAFVTEACRDWTLALFAEEARLVGESGVDGRPRSEVCAAWIRANPRPPCTVRDVADHVDHVREVAGVDHVGLGGDFDGTPSTPDGLADVAGYPSLLTELAGRGWSDAELARLTWSNALRVLRATEAVAVRARRERGPSVATLAQLDGEPAAAQAA